MCSFTVYMVTSALYLFLFVKRVLVQVRCLCSGQRVIHPQRELVLSALGNLLHFETQTKPGKALAYPHDHTNTWLFTDSVQP